MRQRVGLARALAADPDFLLMDEPLGALDALTRERMQTLLLDIWAGDTIGVLMVTHGIEEALLLGTRVVVMAPDPGRIVRIIETGFGRRYAAGEPVRSIKADADFIAAGPNSPTRSSKEKRHDVPFAMPGLIGSHDLDADIDRAGQARRSDRGAGRPPQRKRLCRRAASAR